MELKSGDGSLLMQARIIHIDKKLYRSKLSSHKYSQLDRIERQISQEYPSRKYRKRKRAELSYQEVFDIVFEAIVEQEQYRSIARAYRVSEPMIT